MDVSDLSLSDLSLYMRTRTLSDVLLGGVECMYISVYLNKASRSGSPP